MSRFIKNILSYSKDTQIEYVNGVLTFKGKNISTSLTVNDNVGVELNKDENSIKVNQKDAQDTKVAPKFLKAITGTTYKLIFNAIYGIEQGFSKKLILFGVGYRAILKGKALELQLGYSHPISFDIPEGVKIEVPSQTEIVLSSHDKQLLGQTAANIRQYRRTEPYKGKGIRYSDEVVYKKEVKKK